MQSSSAAQMAVRAALVGACALGGCVPDQVTAPSPPPLPSQTPVCPNQRAAIDDERLREDGDLTGDVDGDGADDDIFIVTDRSGALGCKSFLVVDTGSARLSVPADPSEAERALPVPSLSSLVEIDRDPGAEVIVNIETGASTQLVGAFTVHAGILKRITIEGEGPGPFSAELAHDDLFAFGGSVGHIEAVDCGEEGFVIISAAIPEGARADRYEVERRFFRVEGAALTLEEEMTETHTVDGTDLVALPEFRGSPFLGCD